MLLLSGHCGEEPLGLLSTVDSEEVWRNSPWNAGNARGLAGTQRPFVFPGRECLARSPDLLGNGVAWAPNIQRGNEMPCTSSSMASTMAGLKGRKGTAAAPARVWEVIPKASMGQDLALFSRGPEGGGGLPVGFPCPDERHNKRCPKLPPN